MPIRELALRLIGPDATIDASSGALCVARCPKIGPEAYVLRIFPGISDAMLTSYEEIHQCTIIEFYRRLLGQMNGARLFEVSLLGVPPMMAKRPPQVDRSTSWPLDIGTGQSNGRRDFDSTPTDFFIGYGPYSDDEHLGYFLWPNGGVEALRRNGDRHGQWNDFASFLIDELARAEAAYPKYEEAMRLMLRRNTGWRGWLRHLRVDRF